MRLPKRISGVPSPLMVAMREAIKAGLEIWQVSAASRYLGHHVKGVGAACSSSSARLHLSSSAVLATPMPLCPA